jgi:large subunit ribosomal protein L17
MGKKRKGKRLSRSTDQRKALFRSLIRSLILHEEIKTTKAKAKAIKSLFDKLIRKAKVGSLHVRRQLLAFLPDKSAVNKLVDEVAPRFKKKTSGFTRFVALGKRRGDNAMMVKVELTEKKQEEKQVKDKKEAKKTKKKTSKAKPRKDKKDKK